MYLKQSVTIGVTERKNEVLDIEYSVLWAINIYVVRLKNMYLSIYIQSNERIEYIMYIFIFKNQLNKNIFVASQSHASVIGCILVAGKLSNPKFTRTRRYNYNLYFFSLSVLKLCIGSVSNCHDNIYSSKKETHSSFYTIFFILTRLLFQ